MNSDTNSVSSVCFRRNDFNLYVFLMFIIIMYLCYIVKKIRDERLKIRDERLKKETFISENDKTNENINIKNQIIRLQDELFACKTSHQMCASDLQQTRTQLKPHTSSVSLNRIYNPLVPPERTYPTGRFNQAPNDDYQQIGFIFNDYDRYPLYGRPKYPGRTDKYEYYIIDETRNRLKIPYKSRNDNEMYDGDNIRVDILKNDFTVKIYEYDNFRYNPNVL